MPAEQCTGTEEGLVHRCSVTYSEQYLSTYSGHMGPVTALQWCPFRPSLFLSASADWTLKLWEEGQVGCSQTLVGTSSRDCCKA